METQEKFLLEVSEYWGEAERIALDKYERCEIARQGSNAAHWRNIANHAKIQLENALKLHKEITANPIEEVIAESIAATAERARKAIVDNPDLQKRIAESNSLAQARLRNPQYSYFVKNAIEPEFNRTIAKIMEEYGRDVVIGALAGKNITSPCTDGNTMPPLPIMQLYHATTQKKAKLYRQTGAIRAPVRGSTTIQAAMAWAMKVGRTVIIEFDADKPYKLPDHHNAFGEAWWNDGDVTNWRCVFSAIGDA